MAYRCLVLHLTEENGEHIYIYIYILLYQGASCTHSPAKWIVEYQVKDVKGQLCLLRRSTYNTDYNAYGRHAYVSNVIEGVPAAVGFAMHLSNIWSDHSYIEIHVMDCIAKGVIASPIPDNLTKFYELWKSWLYEIDLLKYSAFKMSFISRWPMWLNMVGFSSSYLKYTPHGFFCTEQVARSLACDFSSAMFKQGRFPFCIHSDDLIAQVLLCSSVNLENPSWRPWVRHIG